MPIDRETLEECCLEVEKLEHFAKIIFEFVGDKQLLEVHVYLCDEFLGIPRETEGILCNLIVELLNYSTQIQLKLLFCFKCIFLELTNC